MDGRMKENMTSLMHVRLFEKGNLIFNDIGQHAGLEVAGAIDHIMMA